MSLVNSMINQIGREIGKDVYKSLSNKNKQSLNDQFTLNKVKHFNLSAYDKTTLNNLVNLVENSALIDVRKFDQWEEYFIELDKKIDFCKENLDKKHLPKLEELDEQNQKDYEVAKIFYKSHIIDSVKSKIEKYEKSSVLIPIILSILCLNSAYYKTGWWTWHLIGMIIASSSFYKGFNISKPGTIELNGNIILSISIYGLILLASFIRIYNEYREIKKLKEETLPKLLKPTIV